MPKVNITKAALREVQKLSHEDLRRVLKIINRLGQEDHRNTLHLKGRDGLLRTRVGRLRVVWRPDGDNILVVKVGYRRDIYRDDLEERNLQSWNLALELVDEDADAVDVQEVPITHPLYYRWHQEKDDAWHEFVYGGYRRSPVLTQEQEDVYRKLLASLHNRASKGTWLIQSAPGTGKTVCAALLACRLHQERDWNIILLVPAHLVENLEKYPEVQQQLQQPGFWLGTFRDWLHQTISSLPLATPAQELSALQRARSRVPGNYRSKIGEIQPHDVLLYQAFILDQNNLNQGKAIYQANINRINILKKIQREWWREELHGQLCRLDAVNRLLEKLPSPPNPHKPTIFIIDEAQDFLLAELQALITLRQEWQKQQDTYLWLLGDLNQRIQPTDFHWDQLKLGKETSLWCNYRNSQRILEFSNQFLEFATRASSKYGGRQLPKPANPENAFEVGERVRLLECSSYAEALEFLEQLAPESGREENKRYLLYELANAVKVLSTNLPESYKNLGIWNAERAKGQEFEACVAFCIFQGTGTPSLEESFKWYTMLTRACSRLLVVATTAELQRIGDKYFEKCDRIDSQRAISWITEVASDVDLNQITDDVQRRLLERCESSYLYWDTYPALQLAGVEGESLYQWEREAITRLSKHSNSRLDAELQKTQNISLRCLLLRAMQYSWQAVSEASIIKNSEGKEYSRLLESIARDLEAKNLPYEAARVRLHLNDALSINLPFWEEVSRESEQPQPLVTSLCQAFTSRLANFIQNQEINE